MKRAAAICMSLIWLWTVSAAGEPGIESVEYGTEIVAPEELVRGQLGWGLSVFAGSEPERFEVEVLGVARNSTPELSYILARLTGLGLERSGVAAGMSGSPVYFDGKLAGAVAYSYPYGLDAIAGITPIGGMRRLSDLPLGTSAMEIPVATGLEITFDDLVKRTFSRSLLEQQLQRLLAPAVSEAGSPSAPAWRWTMSGFGPMASNLVTEVLGVPVSGLGGGAVDEVPGEIQAGSAVAALMVDGDMIMAAHGTVTERRGDEILAFGHPLFSFGPVSIPMARSEVITVLANAVNSFKISNAGPVIGAFDQDREPGARGYLGMEPDLMPVDIHLSGMVEKSYHMRIAEIRQMRPLLTTLAALGALNGATFSAGPHGIDLEARYRLGGYEDLVIRQSFDGDQAGVDSVLFLLGFGAFLDLNDLETVDVEGVEIRFHQVDRPRKATLVSAHPERLRVEPGDRVAVHLELAAHRGGRFRRVVEVEIPQHLGDGKYVVLLGDGTSMDAARLLVEKSSPETFAQALRRMAGFHSRRHLQILGLVGRRGLTSSGEVYPDLPGSVRSIFSSSGFSAADPLSLAIVHEQVLDLENPIEGVARIDFQVRRPRD